MLDLGIRAGDKYATICSSPELAFGEGSSYPVVIWSK